MPGVLCPLAWSSTGQAWTHRDSTVCLACRRTDPQMTGSGAQGPRSKYCHPLTAESGATSGHVASVPQMSESDRSKCAQPQGWPREERHHWRPVASGALVKLAPHCNMATTRTWWRARPLCRPGPQGPRLCVNAKQ